jgi:hypothetical protein
LDIRFKASDGTLWDTDWRDFELMQERDPDGYTVPGPDLNGLLLTAEDCVWLWSMGIRF